MPKFLKIDKNVTKHTCPRILHGLRKNSEVYTGTHTSRHGRICVAFLAGAAAKAPSIHVHHSIVPPVSSAKLSYLCFLVNLCIHVITFAYQDLSYTHAVLSTISWRHRSAWGIPAIAIYRGKKKFLMMHKISKVIQSLQEWPGRQFCPQKPFH